MVKASLGINFKAEMMVTPIAIEDVPIPEKLPFLESICWQTENVYLLTPKEMLSRYERGWHYRQLFGNLEGEELYFLKTLAAYYHSWLIVDL